MSSGTFLFWGSPYLFCLLAETHCKKRMLATIKTSGITLASNNPQETQGILVGCWMQPKSPDFNFPDLSWVPATYEKPNTKSFFKGWVWWGWEEEQWNDTHTDPPKIEKSLMKDQEKPSEKQKNTLNKQELPHDRQERSTGQQTPHKWKEEVTYKKLHSTSHVSSLRLYSCIRSHQGGRIKHTVCHQISLDLQPSLPWLWVYMEHCS